MFVVFVWFYLFALVLPVNTSAVAEPWAARGRAWLGALVAQMLDGLSFLWGSLVRAEYAEPPETAWPTLVFAVLVVGLVYASVRTGSDRPGAVGVRVLGACVLAGGLTNLFSVILAAGKLRAETGPFGGSAPEWVADGIWFGIVLGLIGSSVAYTLAALPLLASLATGASDGTDSPVAARRPALSTARARAGQVATWGALPLLVAVLVGGFVWDYGPDADPDAIQQPRASWVRLVWFAHARFAGPHNPHSLTGEFDTSVWLPRTLTSLALVVLIWVGLRLLVAGWQRGDEPNGVAIVVRCAGLVAVLALVLGVIEGAVLPTSDPGPAAYYVALGNVTDAVRFGACFGWLVGVAVAVSQRISGGSIRAADSADDVLEGSAD
ncbi:hypothetical protein UG56_000935 [Nocardioides luteus]|uniref:Uncharacterized protein n=1 Tax=Nocardioides luteus TaxID=1844 RepID=A0A1J4NB81_9ACTN|nr:hypothetical protein UG56_000935 [Nocardioides luteus]